MSHGQQQIEERPARTGERGTGETRKRGANDSPLIGHIMAAMREYKAVTIKIAEELGFEHREEPTAEEVKKYLLDIPMNPDDYALLHKIGGKLTLCRMILDDLHEALNISPAEMDEATALVSYAYDVCGSLAESKTMSEGRLSRKEPCG